MQTRRLEPSDWPSAINDVEGPQLVVAGPGTGKTEFLVRRAVRLIAAGHAAPGQIVILTFSRRSASELAARIAGELGQASVGIDVSTFHSFAHRLLEAHSDRPVGALLTGPEQIRMVAGLLQVDNPLLWPLPFRGLLASQTFAEDVTDFLLRCRERLLGPAELGERASSRADWRALPHFFETYIAHLRGAERIDYGTLLVDAIDCLDSAAVAEAVADQHHFVLVDEYQDTSPAQARMLELLTLRRRNLTVAGDPYQSIYSFRGADLHNMAAFPERFIAVDGIPARRFVLSKSFRVPSPIMEAALRVTTTGDLPGSAGRVEPANHAGRVEAYVFDQQSAEAEWIASEVERLLVEEQLDCRSVAVLVRSKRRLLPELSRALERRRIPHDTPDSRLVDHPFIRIVLDLTMAAALSSLDPDTSPGVDDELDATMRRILLGPLFGLAVVVERDLLRTRRRIHLPWPEVLRRHLPEASVIADLLEETSWATHMTAAAGFWKIWTGVEAFTRLVADPNGHDDRAALASFSQALGRQAERDPGLTLLGYAELSQDDDFEATPLLSSRRNSDRVVLTTLHQAKGLEFDVVFIADAAEDVFPDTRRSRSLLQPHLLAPELGDDPGAQIRFRLQEEMRLAYTAMTRARTRVIWTATGAGIEENGNRPSRFLIAAAGVGAVADLSAPPDRAGGPVSALEFETLMRRTLSNPGESPAQRMAAVSILAGDGIETPWDVATFPGLAKPGPDTGIVAHPIRLSPSQAEAYETCPRRYAFERRVRLQEPTSPYLTFGGLIHAVLETSERRALETGRQHSTVDEALGLLDQMIKLADFGSPVLAEAWQRRGAELLDRLYREWPDDSKQPARLEHRLSLDLDGVRWLGRADRIEHTEEGTLRIVDYKTGSTPLSKAEAAQSLQLGFYLLAASTDPELTAIGRAAEAQLWYPLAAAKGWRPAFDPSMTSTVVDRLTAVSNGIRNEDWTARVGVGCRGCSVRIVCDRWPEGREAFVE